MRPDTKIVEEHGGDIVQARDALRGPAESAQGVEGPGPEHIIRGNLLAGRGDDAADPAAVLEVEFLNLRRDQNPASPRLHLLGQNVAECADAAGFGVKELGLRVLGEKHRFDERPERTCLDLLIDRCPVDAGLGPVAMQIGTCIVQKFFRIRLEERPEKRPPVLLDNVVFERLGARFPRDEEVQARLNEHPRW